VSPSRWLAIAAMASAASCGGGADPVSGAGGGVTLLDVQSQVFTPRCGITGCHVGPAAPFGLDLSSASNSAANLVGVVSAELPPMQRVLPGDSANSYVYWKITGNPGINGDQMPLSGGPLSAADVDLVAAWIDGGAN